MLLILMTYSKISLLTSVEFQSLEQLSWMRLMNGLDFLRVSIFRYCVDWLISLLLSICLQFLFLCNFQCLLVKGWKGSSWSFPRGKKSKDEEDHACAIREVSIDSILF